MSWRYKGGFIQEFFDPTQPGTPIPGLFSWGNNSNGQLGQNDLNNRSSPTQIGYDINWTSATATNIENVSFATKSTGSLWSWGANPYGMLGLNDVNDRSSPTQIGALTNWTALNSIKGYTANGVKADGTLWAWGRNDKGQIGDISIIDRSSPVQVGALTTWNKAVSTGRSSSLATKTDGTLWSWGSNVNGQLGTNVAVATVRSSPVQIGSLTTWSKVSAGYTSITGVLSTGTMWSWGSNAYGQLGINSQVDRSSPTQVGALTTWLSATCGSYHVLAIKTDGTLWSWGQNTGGCLGLGTTASGSSPVQIGSLTNWTANLGAGYANSFAITSSGTLFGWGTSASGALGNNLSTGSLSSPVQLGSLTTWTSVAVGYNGALAIANT